MHLQPADLQFLLYMDTREVLKAIGHPILHFSFEKVAHELNSQAQTEAVSLIDSQSSITSLKFAVGGRLKRLKVQFGTGPICHYATKVWTWRRKRRANVNILDKASLLYWYTGKSSVSFYFFMT